MKINKKINAFTIIELLVCIVLIGVVASLIYSAL